MFNFMAILAMYCRCVAMEGKMELSYYVYALLAINCVCQLHFILCTIHEMADALEIKVLTVKPIENEK